MPSNTTATAPELTQEQVQRVLVQPLEAASTFLASGPRIFDTNGSPVRVPKMGGPISVDWVARARRSPTTRAPTSTR